MDYQRAWAELLRDMIREAQREADRAIREGFSEPLEQWLNDLLSRRLPHDWQAQLRAKLQTLADDGFTLRPNSLKTLEQWILAQAERRGLLPSLQGQHAFSHAPIGGVISDLLPSENLTIIDLANEGSRLDGIHNLIANDTKKSSLKLSEQLRETAENKNNPAPFRILAGTLVPPAALFDTVPDAVHHAAADARAQIVCNMQTTHDPVQKVMGGVAYTYATVGEGFSHFGLATAQGELLGLPGQMSRLPPAAVPLAPNNPTALARRLGAAGEEAAGITKNTERISSLSGAKTHRVPDEMTKVALTEVKNVKKLSFTKQIQDALHFSMMTRRRFILYVRKDTIISKPLLDAINAGYIELRYLP